MAKLGEVCLLKAGKFVSANDISPEYNKGLYPCFGGNGIRGYVADYTHDGEFPLIGRQGALCGNVNLASGKFHATEHAVVVQPKIEMNVHWLYYALNAMNLGQYATGAAQPGLAVSKLETLSIEIPNISEQNKIAQTLYKVEQLVNFRKQQLAKLDELVKARFVEMFGDPIANPKQYKCYTVDDIIQFQGGSQPDKKFFEYEKTPDNIRLIQIRDYRTDKFATYIPTTMAKRFCTAEDIMIGRYGPPIFQILQGLEGSFNVALMKAIPKRGNREFIRWFLKQDCLLHYLEGLSKRTAGQDGIQIDKLKAYPFPYPPDELQNEFASFVERVDQQKQTVQQSLEKLELMKKALMQEYFG